MQIADTGSSMMVKGRSSAMASGEDRPGSAPNSTPISTPAITSAMLWRLNASPRPSRIGSMCAAQLRLRPKTPGWK